MNCSFSEVRESEPLADKCLQRASRVDVGAQRGSGAVDTHPATEAFDVAVQQAEKGHAGLQTALILAFDRLGIEPSRAGREALDGLMDSQQQLLDPSVGLHGFAALAAEASLADIPQRGCTGELAAELNHRSADRHAAHDRGLTRSGQGAPFQVEQNLATDFFHNDWFLGFPALGKDTVVQSVRRYAKSCDSENKTPCEVCRSLPVTCGRRGNDTGNDLVTVVSLRSAADGFLKNGKSPHSKPVTSPLPPSAKCRLDVFFTSGSAHIRYYRYLCQRSFH